MMATTLLSRHPRVQKLKRDNLPSFHGNKFWTWSWFLMDYFRRRGLPKKSYVMDVGVAGDWRAFTVSENMGLWLQTWISIPKFSHSSAFTQRFMMCELPPCGIPGAISRKEERSKATPPFGFAQGHESFDPAQDREPVERLFEWQMMRRWWIRVGRECLTFHVEC